MDHTYFKSTTDELLALGGRVRGIIGDKHWASDGQWKESVLRNVLRRSLPDTIGVGTGFVMFEDGISTQQDVIVYCRDRPKIFRDGDFLILTPDAVLGLIEVKSTFYKSKFADESETLRQNIARVRDATQSLDRESDIFAGIFYYDGESNTQAEVERLAVETTRLQQVINYVSIGPNAFIRFWPLFGSVSNNYVGYGLDGTSHTYFINNAVFAMRSSSFSNNQKVLFPDYYRDKIRHQYRAPFR